jgi:hypothetical protein
VSVSYSSNKHFKSAFQKQSQLLFQGKIPGNITEKTRNY